MILNIKIKSSKILVLDLPQQNNSLPEMGRTLSFSASSKIKSDRQVLNGEHQNQEGDHQTRRLSGAISRRLLRDRDN